MNGKRGNRQSVNKGKDKALCEENVRPLNGRMHFCKKKKK